METLLMLLMMNFNCINETLVEFKNLLPALVTDGDSCFWTLEFNMPGKMEVAYWDIRGLGAPLRMICYYAEADFEPVLHTIEAKEGGGWASTWFTEVKPPLAEKNALINLPYIVDGDVVVTQSNACMTYLGRKFNLNGKNDTEMIRVDQTLCQVFDLRNDAVKFFYSSEEQVEQGLTSFLEGVAKHYTKLDGFMAQNKTKFLASDEPTVPDFHFFELILQIEELTTKYNRPSAYKSLPQVAAFYDAFKALPAIEKYLKSDLHALPINNKMAGFGATPAQ